MTATLVPGTDAWRALVTASKVSAILGISPWESPRSIWHLMRGDLPPTEQTAVQARGHHLEAAILGWFFADRPHLTRHGGEVTVTRPDLPWAAGTPDDLATTPDGEVVPVDAKTDGRGHPGWGEPGTDQVPLHLLTQAMWVMHLGGYRRFWFARLGPFLEMDVYEVAYDADLGRDIEARCGVFWASLDGDDPPPVDEHEVTYDAIRAVAGVGKGDWQCPPDLARQLVSAREGVDAAEAAHNLARSRVLDAMGDAKRVVIGDPAAPLVLGQKQKTKTGCALYPPRRPVTAADLPPTPEQETQP